MKETSGTLLYRLDASDLEVLLVHPSGNYNRKSPWSIPKGLPDPGESLEDAARRETLEETGVVANQLTYMGYADYTKSKKRVHCFAGPSPDNARPHCASWEVDKAEFLTIKKALKAIHPDQLVFLQRLLDAFQQLAAES
jgi:predicted NUDIX family NTP pyrophosphohydrolase